MVRKKNFSLIFNAMKAQIEIVGLKNCLKTIKTAGFIYFCSGSWYDQLPSTPPGQECSKGRRL
jgi:hypothetical protein